MSFAVINNWICQHALKSDLEGRHPRHSPKKKKKVKKLTGNHIDGLVTWS
jgi:hypothetical protein